MKFSRSLSLAFAGGVLLGAVGTVAGASVRGSSIFTDVQQGAYYDDAIGDMYAAGIVKGLTADTFGPNDFITRGQVAVMMQRFRNEMLGISSDGSSRTSRSSSSSSSSVASSSSSSAFSSAASKSPNGAFRFTTTSFSAGENEKIVTISIVRTGGAKGAVNVNYAVTPGTAQADVDYTPISGTLVFADGATSKSLTVTIIDDTLAEGNETMTISLSNPTGGSQLDTGSTATITITDNESGGSASSGTSSSGNTAGTIEFGATGYTVSEDGGSILITVNRTGGSSGTVGVSYATSNSTATSGTHYTATNGTLSFASGETSKTFSVPIIDNSGIEGAKKFGVSLSTVTGGASLGTSSSTVNILDNDASAFTFGTGSVKFSVPSMNVQEGQSAVVTISRVGGTKGVASVKYATYGSGTATSGDYTNTTGTMTFQPGESSKTFKVPTIKDSNSDPGEDFQVRLSEPSTGVTIISPETITITIDQ